MAKLKGTKTEDNLKAAFAGESQANRRYLYFAQKADVEGFNDVAAVFRSTAEGETGHAHGHLEYLEQVGDPATGLPFGETKLNLKTAIAGETHEYTDMYPGMAKTAREEGHDEVAERVARLTLGDRAEQRSDVGVALDVGLLGEVQVAPVRLALAGERFLEVLVGLRAVQIRHAPVSPFVGWIRRYCMHRRRRGTRPLRFPP